MKKGVVLLGHGSRAVSANRELYKIAEIIQENKRYDILEVAFLQLCPPFLEQGINSCISQGATDIIIVPYFLFSGNHVKIDIPMEVDKIRERLPHITISLADHIGADPVLADIVCNRIEDSIIAGSA